MAAPHSDMSELDDFEAFTSDFDAVRFASSLLQATNANDAELDLATPLKKLHFDAAECTRRMETLAAAHSGPLLANCSALEAHSALLHQSLLPSAARLKAAYKRITDEVVAPYDDAVALHDALKKIHRTVALLRGSSFFVAFLQQLQECEADADPDVVRLAKLYTQLATYYNQTAQPDLLSLRLVREFGPQLSQRSAAFTAALAEKVANDLAHHSTFTASNESLRNSLVASYVMAPSRFTASVDAGCMAKSVQIALSSLTRALQSPRALAATFAEVRVSAGTFAATLSALLDGCRVPAPDSPHETLLHVFQRDLADSPQDPLPTIESVYWAKLAAKFQKSVATTLSRGGPIARNLRAQHATIVQSVHTALSGDAAAYMEDALSTLAQ